ncbi:MAG: aldo/keto reductase [Bacillota bacterium]|jgi:aryl-alcohol dehydrogenase-like predicted oxidoreductase|nr:aldo/keto reductase [Bacillota bacterium]HOB90779.1 aldo/keto reductase [Bacillota bacterium]HPZ54040.1 aldo/keto reductase [Bacillota bacterium]HQD17511.1 aldo/keto reductase [Bacillota bacterium]
MDYRVHRGVELSAVGVGCYSLSGAYGRKDVDQVVSMLQRAYELGVNLFDTAEAYGDAETVLGDAVRPFRDKVLISTKVGVREGIKPSLTRSYVHAACEDSLRRLKTDWIDIYSVHFDDPDTPVEETVEALDDLIAQGKIRSYGLGHLPLSKAVEYMTKGSVFSVLMEFSAVSRQSSRQLIFVCQQHGAAAIAFSVTGRGLLTGRVGRETRFEEGDIDKDAHKAFVDLVYCIETAMTLGYVEEPQIMPVFYKLYGMKPTLNHSSISDLEAIRSEMKRVIRIPSAP